MDEVDYILKIVIIGESDVGKTSLMLRYTANKFSENTSNTIGVDHFTMVKYIDTHKVKISFWDTAGQERFRTMANAYYKNAHGIVLVYDVSDRDSFTSMNFWIREIRKNCDKDISIAIIANKTDLDADEWMVTTDEATRYAEKGNYLFEEVSAKTNSNNNIDKVFENLILKILNGNKSNPEFDKTQKEIIRFQKACIEGSQKRKKDYQGGGGNCCN